MIFSIAALSPSPAELTPPRRGLELRLLDQVAILVRDQVALDLAHRVHGDIDNNQQTGAAEAQVGESGLGRDDVRDEADEYQIGGADDGNPIEQPVEIFFGRL